MEVFLFSYLAAGLLLVLLSIAHAGTAQDYTRAVATILGFFFALAVWPVVLIIGLLTHE